MTADSGRDAERSARARRPPRDKSGLQFERWTDYLRDHPRFFLATIFGVITAIVAAITCSLLPPVRVGDGMEYYALYYAWTEDFRPWMTQNSYVAYEQLHTSGTVAYTMNADWLRSAFPTLHVGETSDFNHFWFYSLLAACIGGPLKILGVNVDAHASFMALHALLIACTVGVATFCHGWRGGLVIVLFVVASPIVWFVNKVHTEFFTFCFTVMGIIILTKGGLTLAALAFAAASTQNPGLLVVPVVLLGMRAWRGRKERFPLWEVVAVLATIAILAIHPVYYFARYGAMTTQLIAGGAQPGVALPLFYIWFIDPDIGLFTNWPLGFAFLAAGIGFWRKISRPINGPPIVRDETALWIGMAVFLLASIYSHSSTTNLNSGASPGIARYALWYVALLYPFALASIVALSRSRIALGGLAVVGLTSLAVGFGRNSPSLPENPGTPSAFSNFVQRHLPFVYNPPSEIFVERFSGQGENTARIAAVVGPDCRKTLLRPQSSGDGATIVPQHCTYKASQIQEWVTARRADKPLFRNLTSHDVQPVRIARLGQLISFTDGDAFGRDALVSGWSNPEPWGVWSEGSSAIVDLLIEPLPASGATLTLKINGFTPAGSPVREVGIVVGGGQETPVIFNLDNPTRVVTVHLDASALRRADALRIEFRIKNAISPKAAQMSEDGRMLGVGLVSLQVDP